MDNLMDEWCLQLKRNVLAELANVKAKQIELDEQAVVELKSKHVCELKKMSAEMDSLKEIIYSFEQTVKQKDEMIANLTDALQKQKEKSDKIRMFSMWRLKSNDEHRQVFASKMADKFYMNKLRLKVLDSWRSVVESKWKTRVEKACQIKSQEVCVQLTEDYEERLAGLQKELSASRADVAQLHKERECYEENMKKAFMRGVCALNMEAMTMFRDNNGTPAPPGGADETSNPAHYPCTDTYQQPEDGYQMSAPPPPPPSTTTSTKKHVTFNTTTQPEDGYQMSA